MNKATYMALVDRELDAIKAIIKAKNNDYTAGDASAFANFESTPELASPFSGVLIRLGDKMQRLKTYAAKGKLEVVGEGAEDAARDVIGYALILLGMLEDAKKASKTRMSHVDEAIAQTVAFKALNGAVTSSAVVKQLEIGKYYFNRNGERVGPIQNNTTTSFLSIFPFQGVSDSGCILTFTKEGSWRGPNKADSGNDLIEEAPPPAIKTVDAAHDHS